MTIIGTILLIILLFIILTVILLSIQHIWFDFNNNNKTNNNTEEDNNDKEDNENVNNDNKDDNVRYCKMDKLLCNKGNCFPGVQKRCGKLSQSKCDDSLILCNFMDKNQCQNETNRIFCKYEDKKCNNRVNPHMGIEITKTEYDNKINLGWANNQLNCENELLIQ